MGRVDLIAADGVTAAAGYGGISTHNDGGTVFVIHHDDGAGFEYGLITNDLSLRKQFKARAPNVRHHLTGPLNRTSDTLLICS